MLRSKDVVIVGGGPASLILAEDIQNKGLTVCIIAPSREARGGMLSTTSVNGKDINYVPIYPVSSSIGGLSDDMPRLQTVYDELDRSSYVRPSYSEGSYTDFLVRQSQDDKFIIYSQKVFGDIVHRLPLLNAQKKLMAHYLSKPRDLRIGFVDGRSYYHKKFNSFKNCETLEYEIENINLERKSITFLGDHQQELCYKKMINTIDVRSFYRILGKSVDSEFIFAPATFAILSIEEDMLENLISYDSDPDSPIYRTIVITKNVVSVQVAVGIRAKPESIIRYVAKLLDIAEAGISFIRFLFHKLAYPLDIVHQSSHLKLKVALENEDIFSFGRFGSWEYEDLHELNWSRLYDKI